MATLDLYRDLESKYNDKIIELRNSKISLEGQLSQAYQAYNQALASELDPEAKGNARVTSKARESIEGNKQELKDLEERLTVLEQLKQGKLKALYPSLLEEFNKIKYESIERIQREAEALKRKKADFLLELVKLHNAGKDAKDLYYEIQGIANQLGVSFRERMELPSINMTYTGGGIDKAHAPTSNESMEAYQLAKVAYWIQWYSKTGEILEENTARQRIEQEGGESNDR